MSAKNEHNRDGVVAVGQVNGAAIQILQVDGSEPFFYEFRIINLDGSVYYPHNLFDTISEALDAAVKHLVPDAEPLQVEEPTPDDYAALNAALYVGGAMEDIKDLGAAVGTFMAMGNGLESLKASRAAMASDLEDIEDILASTHHGSSAAIANLNKMAEILQAQSQVLELVLERSREIIAAFISQFIE